MDKYSPVVRSSERGSGWGCAEAADSIEADFSDLIAILDRQLASLPADEAQARQHLVQAKAAAERGLRVSQELTSIVKERADRA